MVREANIGETDVDEERRAYEGVLGFDARAKWQEWQLSDLPWGDIPPGPEGKG